MKAKNCCKHLGMTVALVAGLASALPSQAQTVCVFDPLGVQGNISAMFTDYAVAAKRWKVDLSVKTYADEQKVNDEFKAGRCDMATMIGMRARQYNTFTGSLDAPGILENYAAVRDLMSVISSPQMASRMQANGIEVVGVLPLGAGYAMVNDRRINSLNTAAGHRAAYMEWDHTQAGMASAFNVQGVPSNLDNYTGLFKQGKVDIIVAPLTLYAPMELSRVVNAGGGIIHRPLFQFTLQLVAHQSQFDDKFGQLSRDYVNTQVSRALGLVRNDEAQLDNRTWIYASHAELVNWNRTMNHYLDEQVKAGNFDPSMLSLMRQVECRSSPDDVACSTPGYVSNRTSMVGIVSSRVSND